MQSPTPLRTDRITSKSQLRSVNGTVVYCAFRKIFYTITKWLLKAFQNKRGYLDIHWVWSGSLSFTIFDTFHNIICCLACSNSVEARCSAGCLCFLPYLTLVSKPIYSKQIWKEWMLVKMHSQLDYVQLKVSSSVYEWPSSEIKEIVKSSQIILT